MKFAEDKKIYGAFTAAVLLLLLLQSFSTRQILKVNTWLVKWGVVECLCYIFHLKKRQREIWTVSAVE